MNVKSLYLISLTLLTNLCYCEAQAVSSNIFSDSPIVRDTILYEGRAYYKDNVDNFIIFLYNSTNRPWQEDVKYANGEPIPHNVKLNQPNVIEVNKTNELIAMNIIDNSFSIEQAESLYKESLFITMHLSPVSGEVTDVYFSFTPSGSYNNMPLDIFANIEDALKSSLVFEITNFGKSLNYCYLFWA